MKIYLSADMEGTAGIVHWNETQAGHPQYAYFREQMSREVAAACEGALAAGAAEILVKDAHDSARNIIPSMLPKNTRLFRGWDDSPAMMMAGLDASYDAVLCTGYHAAAASASNPLSHTMSLKVQQMTCNGNLLSEFDINAMIAASFGVPVCFLSGDAGLCQASEAVLLGLCTVATNDGRGSGAIALHPDTACEQIQQTVQQSLKDFKHTACYPLPDHFNIEICFKEHTQAAKAAAYPGVVRKDAKTVTYETETLSDILAAFLFIL